MYGKVDKIKLGKTLLPNWRHSFVPKQIIILDWKKKKHGTAVGIIVVHLFMGRRQKAVYRNHSAPPCGTAAYT